VVCAQVVECTLMDIVVCLLYLVTSHIASTKGQLMTTGANYLRAWLYYTPWHSDIHTPNQIITTIPDRSSIMPSFHSLACVRSEMSPHLGLSKAGLQELVIKNIIRLFC